MTFKLLICMDLEALKKPMAIAYFFTNHKNEMALLTTGGMKMKYLLKNTLVFTFLSLPFILNANAGQVVIVKGNVNNVATGGGQALTNIGSVLGNGSGELKAEGVSQTASIGGSVINVSKGKGSKSEINISTINNRK